MQREIIALGDESMEQEVQVCSCRNRVGASRPSVGGCLRAAGVGAAGQGWGLPARCCSWGSRAGAV